MPQGALNLDPQTLPGACEVLVVGAGPSGSAAAISLARAGLDVVLVDAQAFPRDKVCGDALIPDAHRALDALGLLPTVLAEAQASGFVACIGPRGGQVDVPGELAVLPRKRLDHLLCEAAVAAGARMFAPLRFVQVIESDARVVGARLQHGESTFEVRCQWLLLATGASPQALMASGLQARQTPSGVAMRAYVKNEAMTGRIDALEIVWHRALAPGYGWIFPCKDGTFNIGAGVAESHSAVKARPDGDDAGGLKKTQGVNLRHVVDEFLRVYAPARELMQGGQLLGPWKGAPLRCSLTGARWSRAGLLAVGEAAGSTYSFTGEGIGKALETGMQAAQALLAGRALISNDAAICHDYEARLQRLKPRFELYQRANMVNRYPWLIDLLIWRARKSPRIVRRMSGVLNETSNPGHLISFKGLARLFLDRQ